MHRSRGTSYRGPPRRDFDGRTRSPQQRFGFDYDGPNQRRFDSFRSRSPPRGRPARGGYRDGPRDERSPMGAPFSQARPFGSNRPMYQLRVENLCGDVHDQELKHDLLQIFRRHGNCSVYVVDLGRGMTKEAYVTYWSLEESRIARRSESERFLFGMPMFIHVQREPRVFGTATRPIGHAEMRRENDGGFRHGHHMDGGRPRVEGRGSMSDDSIPTRTLFVGNLDSNVREKTLQEAFGRFGSVEHVDIKAPRNGSNGTFAFVRFAEVASAKVAKQELQQTLIGSCRIRLGYGRGTPSARVHVSGLGGWCTLDWLEQEFDRFGAIHHIEYSNGDSSALVSFDSLDAASAAAREMNKMEGKDQEHLIVVSFAESRSGGPVGHDWDDLDGRVRESGADRKASSSTAAPAASTETDRGEGRQRKRRTSVSNSSSSAGSNSAATGSHSNASNDDQDSATSVRDGQNLKRKHDGSDSDGEEPQGKRSDLSNPSQRSLQEICADLPLLWTGALGLRKMSFPMRMFVVSGDASLASNYLRNDLKLIAITQRLRLDTEKLDEVRRRMASCGPAGHCVLLALASSDEPSANVGSSERTSDAKDDSDGDAQVKPLRNLVLFLKQKQAAGVAQLSLSGETADDKSTATGNGGVTVESGSGVLHAFPPSDFAQEQLSSLVPRTSSATSNQDEDHLVVVIVSK